MCLDVEQRVNIDELIGYVVVERTTKYGRLMYRSIYVEFSAKMGEKEHAMDLMSTAGGYVTELHEHAGFYGLKKKKDAISEKKRVLLFRSTREIVVVKCLFENVFAEGLYLPVCAENIPLVNWLSNAFRAKYRTILEEVA